MRRNYASIKGAGWSRAFEAAAKATPDERQPFKPSEPRPPVCDRSGDLGSTHYWPDGAQHGDRCLCRKRVKWVFEPCAECKAQHPIHKLFAVVVETAKQTHSSPAENEERLLCYDCYHRRDPDEDAEYERANLKWRETHGGEL